MRDVYLQRVAQKGPICLASFCILLFLTEGICCVSYAEWQTRKWNRVGSLVDLSRTAERLLSWLCGRFRQRCACSATKPRRHLPGSGHVSGQSQLQQAVYAGTARCSEVSSTWRCQRSTQKRTCTASCTRGAALGQATYCLHPADQGPSRGRRPILACGTAPSATLNAVSTAYNTQSAPFAAMMICSLQLPGCSQRGRVHAGLLLQKHRLLTDESPKASSAGRSRSSSDPAAHRQGVAIVGVGSKAGLLQCKARVRLYGCGSSKSPNGPTHCMSQCFRGVPLGDIAIRPQLAQAQDWLIAYTSVRSSPRRHDRLLPPAPQPSRNSISTLQLVIAVSIHLGSTA